MGHFARIEGNQVVEVVDAEMTLSELRKRYHPSLRWEEAPQSVTQDMSYENGQYQASRAPQQANANASPTLLTANVGLGGVLNIKAKTS